MKKSISIIFASALALSTVFVGCKKEIEEDPDAVYIEGTRVDFTAQVFSSDGATKSTAGLSGATVTLAAGGETMSSTTDANGNAIFEDLEEGSYAATITMTGYGTLNVIMEIWSPSGDDGAATAQFALFGGTATITGMVWSNGDETNDTTSGGGGSSNVGSHAPNVAPNTVTVTATLEPGNLWDWNTEGSGVNFDDLSYEGATATGTVAAGVYTITVPAAGSGLSYNLRFPDFVFQQVIWDPLTPASKSTEREVADGDDWTVWAYSNETAVEDYDYGDN
jgi:hypothetical protein